MMSKLQPAVLGMAVGASLGLSACGGRDGTSNGSSETRTVAQQADSAKDRTNAKVAAPTLADGPDVCFRAIARHLGANAKVSEITSFFSSGREIDSSDTKPKGEMTICTVQYQNPDDPRKLLSTTMDIGSGEFDPPRPIEITVTGGDAAKFNLENYLIPLSKINAAGLTSVMEAQKARLSGVYSRYAWSGVRLSEPDAFSNTPKLRLDVTGRLASNDIKSGGYAAVTTDAKTITINYLLP